MKTLEGFLKEISENEELRKEFEEAADQDNVVEFFGQHDCEATLEEIVKFVKVNNLNEDELKDDELNSVAGGGWFSDWYNNKGGREKKCVTLFGKRLCI